MSMPRLKLDPAEMRRRIETFFADADNGSVASIGRWIAQEHGRQNLNEVNDHSESLCDEDRLEVVEVLWDLIREGHLNPGRRESPESGWPSVYVTTTGGKYFGNK